MRHAYICLFLLFALSPGSARAVCTLPDGDHGDMLYNLDHTVMQYCNGTHWVSMDASRAGKGGGGIQSGVATVKTEGDACTKTGELAKTSGGKLLVCQDEDITGEPCADFETGSLSFNATGVLHVCTE